jgi:hypothetical protein
MIKANVSAYPSMLSLFHSRVEQWKAAEFCDETACKIALQTWEHRLGGGAGVGRAGVQELLLPANTQAFLLDPLYAQVSKDSEDVSLPQVPWAHENAAHELVARIGGKDALDDLQALQMEGLSVDMCGEVIVCAGKTDTTGARRSCTTNHVAAVKMCMDSGSVFATLGTHSFPKLHSV